MNELILQVLTFIISLFGLAGNASVLWFLGFRMHRNAFYIYILNLAAADSLLLCLYITICLIEFILHINIFTNGFIQMGVFIFYIAGLSMLSAISTERCLSVLWPIWYHCHRPRHTSATVCALLWALSMFLSILDWASYYHLNTTEKHYKKVDLTIIAWLVFLFVVLSGSSLTLLGKMLCGSQRKPLTRLYITILLTVLVFFFCGLPFGIYLFSLEWILNFSQVHFYLYMVVIILSCVNSSANPIIYFFVGSFRQRLWGQNLKLVLERALQDTPEEDEGGGSLSQGTLEMSGSRVEQG
ncbi:mas-related G-protein coupled receptor member X1-like [Sciurus carolinensis]|uniref:mas-related G-protein coupled receptor member X1-like n=1 Tax=Sciurus carolinensis TaxID=30640 RepID=UPI001FB2978E|nr:mas-related G-protein coupled receptor member X1-like [Sciurus carolinensis]